MDMKMTATDRKALVHTFALGHTIMLSDAYVI